MTGAVRLVVRENFVNSQVSTNYVISCGKFKEDLPPLYEGEIHHITALHIEEIYIEKDGKWVLLKEKKARKPKKGA